MTPPLPPTGGPGATGTGCGPKRDWRPVWADSSRLYQKVMTSLLLYRFFHTECLQQMFSPAHYHISAQRQKTHLVEVYNIVICPWFWSVLLLIILSAYILKVILMWKQALHYKRCTSPPWNILLADSRTYTFKAYVSSALFFFKLKTFSSYSSCSLFLQKFYWYSTCWQT